jgi:hypothetical protein
MSEKCVVCNQELTGEDLEFAKDPAAHPGELRVLCPKCYNKSCEEDPAAAILKDFSATINTIQEIITDPLFIKAYKRRYKKQFGGAVIRNNPKEEGKE